MQSSRRAPHHRSDRSDIPCHCLRGPSSPRGERRWTASSGWRSSTPRAAQVEWWGCKGVTQWETASAEHLPESCLPSPCFVTLPQPSLSTFHPCPVIICRCYLPGICCNLEDSEACSHPPTSPSAVLPKGALRTADLDWNAKGNEGKPRPFLFLWGRGSYLMLVVSAQFKKQIFLFWVWRNLNLRNGRQDKFFSALSSIKETFLMKVGTRRIVIFQLLSAYHNQTIVAAKSFLNHRFWGRM